MEFFARFVLHTIIVFKQIYFRFMTYLFSAEMRSTTKKYGENVHIYFPFTIKGFKEMEIGNNIHINQGAYINAQGGLKIMDNVHIGPNLLIYTVNHNYMGDALPYDSSAINKPVLIGKNVWIGANVTIAPGSTIGDGAIIGAGVVVSGEIPTLTVVVSSRPKIIKYRDKEHYDRLEQLGRYGGVNGKLYTKEKIS
jgi:acetyltransferase-like isoleucine patch superfamily enzyme